MISRTKHRPDQSALYRLSEQQAGYFTTAQASAAGFTRPLLAFHARSGKFQRVKHGIYRLAHFPDMPHADLIVAFLEVGSRAVMSHESALTLYDLSDILPGSIHLTVPRTSSRRHSALRLHTSRIARDEVTQRAGLPVTTVPRTIADLIVGHRPEEQVRQVIREALQRGLVSRQALLNDAKKRGGRIEAVVYAEIKE
jgi:predicted transcriptional regulator of viral defense system